MNNFRKLFGSKKCSVIGMIHLKALPGTPKYEGSIKNIISHACKEADVYLNSGIDGLLIENMNDVPYEQINNSKPEITAVFSRVCNEIKRIINNSGIPCGVQVLAGGNTQAIAVAQACELDFVRVEGFVYSHIGDEGFLDSCAGSLLRYRRKINADNILIFTDIKKKHSSHSITSDISLQETAKAAEFFLSDGVILTGTSTGCPADVTELQQLKNSVSLPILVGSGVTYNNLQDYLSADAVIVGSYFKKDGYWGNNLQENSIKKFIQKINSLN